MDRWWLANRVCSTRPVLGSVPLLSCHYGLASSVLIVRASSRDIPFVSSLVLVIGIDIVMSRFLGRSPSLSSSRVGAQLPLNLT